MRLVDKAHCCDTCQSLWILIGRHRKATSCQRACNPALVSETVQNGPVTIYIKMETVCLTPHLPDSWIAYWVPNTHTRKLLLIVKYATGGDQASLYYSLDKGFHLYIPTLRSLSCPSAINTTFWPMSFNCRVRKGRGSQSEMLCAGKYSGRESRQWVL